VNGKLQRPPLEVKVIDRSTQVAKNLSSSVSIQRKSKQNSPDSPKRMKETGEEMRAEQRVQGLLSSFRGALPQRGQVAEEVETVSPCFLVFFFFCPFSSRFPSRATPISSPFVPFRHFPISCNLIFHNRQKKR